MRQRAARPWARFLLLMVALMAVYVLAAPPVHAQTTPANYDADGDGLIEIASLAQLNAVRWDLNGDGAVDDTANSDAYATAFPVNDGGSVCPADTTCIGYELTANLDFDQNGDGQITSADSAYWNSGTGWQPIGGQFSAVFDGNGHTISNLFISISSSASNHTGLFGWVHTGGEIRNLGLAGADVTGRDYVGSLAGYSYRGTISASYSTGSVRGTGAVGGLVGLSSGTIKASYSASSVSGDEGVGGLAGFNSNGTVIASYATGLVTGDESVGSLVGYNTGTISASYYDSESSGNPTGAYSKSNLELTTPTGYTGIYADWNLDLDGDGTNDDPWDFGVSDQYPALQVDSNDDSRATWQEFGYQLRQPLRLDGTSSGLQATLSWNAITTTYWTETPSLAYALYQDGDEITGYDGNSLTYTVIDLVAEQTYTYQVAVLFNGVEVGRSNLASIDAGNTGDGGLIEVSSLAQLNAIRWDLNGDGLVDDEVNSAAYGAAFPVDEGGSVCPAGTSCAGYELMANLDFDGNGDGEITAADPYWNDGAGWQPIGSKNFPFTATFDGDGHTIANLYIKRRSGEAGLFGSVKGNRSEIRNLGLVSVDVDGNDYTGGLAGNNAGTISSTYSIGSVRGNESVGGLIGQNDEGEIRASYSIGSVRGNESVGGLVGFNHRAAVKASYSSGSVRGNQSVGGIAGFNSGTISASYSTGSVSGNRDVGGAVGLDNLGAIRASYYNRDISGDGTHSRTTTELTTPTGYTDIYTDWNLDLDGDGTNDDPWDFGANDQYPALRIDTNDDERATWQEFGYQLRQPLRLAGTSTGLRATLSWNAITTTYWTDPLSVTYALYRNGQKVEDYDGTSTTYIDASLAVAQTYVYEVVALLNGVEAVRSNRSERLGYRLSEPLRLTATVSGAQATLNWNAITITDWTDTPSITYILYKDGENIAGYDGTSPTYTDTGLTAGQTYTYQVAVLLNGVEAGRSNSVSVGNYDDDSDGLIEISTLAQLDAIRHDLNGDGSPLRDPAGGAVCPAVTACKGYELMANLDFDANGDGRITNADPYWNNGLGWRPIGTLGSPYNAVFAGNGNTISNLYSNHSHSSWRGLFGQLGTGGEIENIGVTNVYVVGDKYVGGLAGESYGTIRNSYATGTVRGTYDTGGLVGEIWGPLTSSYASVSVNGRLHTGGLVGENERAGNIRAGYATGTVNSRDDVGGLVGFADLRSSMSVGYATGVVKGNSNVSGLVGSRYGGTISASYYDSETSGRGTDAYAKTTAELTAPTGYTGIYSSWNLDLDGDGTADDPWDFGTSDEYPALKVDFNGDGDATWQEFGHQLRQPPRLTAATSGSQVELSWNAVATSHWTPEPSVAYVLYRDGEKMTGYDGSSTTYTDTGLTAGQTYTYQVATLLNGIETRRGNMVTATSDAESPAQSCAKGITVTNPDENQSLVQDCVALLTARDILVGTATLNWGADEPIAQWDGVEVSDGRVQSLELRDNELNGSIPRELGQLDGLKRLWLSDNPMSGSIPAELGQLSQLTLLRLDRNDLSGSIPAELGQLSQLTALSAHSNGLSGSIPAELGQLSQLKVLRLSGNVLSGSIPVELGQLAQLRSLMLDINGLSGSIPAELGQLTHLTVLLLHINQLSGSIPEELGELSELSMLRIGYNEFSGCIPAELEGVASNDFASLELPYCGESK